MQGSLKSDNCKEEAVLHLGCAIGNGISAAVDSNSQITAQSMAVIVFSFLPFLVPKFMVIWQDQRWAHVFPFLSSQMFPHMLTIARGKVSHCVTPFSLHVLGLAFWLTTNESLFQKRAPLLKDGFLLCLVMNPPVFNRSVFHSFFVSAFLWNWLTRSSSQVTRKHTAEQFYFVLHFYVHLRVNPITAVGNSITDIDDK